MQKRRKVLVQTTVGLLILLGVILVWTQTPHCASQPVYKGLNLAQWLGIAVRQNINGYIPAISSQGRQPAKDPTPEQVGEADEAVRAIGTNALPFLLAWINPKPSPLKTFYRRVLDLLPLPEHARGFLWGLPGTKDDMLPWFALHGFRLLNTNSLPAVAELSKLANDTNQPSTQVRATAAISAISNTPPP